MAFMIQCDELPNDWPFERTRLGNTSPSFISSRERHPLLRPSGLFRAELLLRKPRLHGAAPFAGELAVVLQGKEIKYLNRGAHQIQ